MIFRKPYIKLFFSFLFLLLLQEAGAQYRVQGTVYDSSHTYGLEAVSVLSTNGSGTITDANGHYQIFVGEKDSIWFSYLNKPTVKFPVLKMVDVNRFDIALQVSVRYLPEVKIRPRNYKLDSIQNRRDYAKVFDYRKPNLASMTSVTAAGAGFDVNEIIRSFQFRKNRSMMRFQERLLLQEQEKFIAHRFNKALVIRLTGLTGDALNEFIQRYTPSYEFTLYSSDYDFQSYIKEAFAKYKEARGT